MIVLRHGKIYDPANGIAGEEGDLWMEGACICPAPAHPDNYTEIDARGWIVAPGAIEPHAHVAGTPLMWARRLLAEAFGPTVRLLPTPAEIGQAYLKLGFTTVFDAATSPLYAWQAHTDLEQMGPMDRGLFTLIGDQACVLEAVNRNDPALLGDTLSWLLEVSGGYALKLVNPGIGSAWRSGNALNALDAPLGKGDLTQRRLLLALAAAASGLHLPHPIHIHAGNLGIPNNWQNFCDTVQALEGLPAHFCHIQYYSYGADESGRPISAARQVADGIAQTSELTFDVGQVFFGPALVVTADLQVVRWLQQTGKSKWMCQLFEGEGGVGILPLLYQPNDPINAIQWATGLELLLRFPDPSRLFLTVDYPNGGSFLAYPRIISWLMEREARQRMLAEVHPAAGQWSGLASLEREYRLDEIIAMSSSGPARALGLKDRGSLAPGMLADVRCYRLEANTEEMFAHPALVIKNGQVVVEEGEIVSEAPGRTLAVRPEWDGERQPFFDQVLARSVTIDPHQYSIGYTKIAERLGIIPCT